MPISVEEPKDHSERFEVPSNNPCDAKRPYQEAIGSLMYPMIRTRPGIAFPVGKLSQFCEKPEEKHWTAVKPVLRYISGTRNLKLSLMVRKTF